MEEIRLFPVFLKPSFYEDYQQEVVEKKYPFLGRKMLMVQYHREDASLDVYQ